MVTNKRKKNTRQRGSKTHGWGSMKKHRGFGNRGGKGMAGSGKRSDARKPSTWNAKYFGKFGFKKKNQGPRIKPFNFIYLEENINSLVKKKFVEKENDYYNVDAQKLGFNKLLSQGKITKKFRIKVSKASKQAIEKIKSASGEVIGLDK